MKFTASHIKHVVHLYKDIITIHDARLIIKYSLSVLLTQGAHANPESQAYTKIYYE